MRVQGGGVKLENYKTQKNPKSTLLADNTQGLITTKQTKPRPVASAPPHPITPAYVKMDGECFFFERSTHNISYVQIPTNILLLKASLESQKSELSRNP